MAETSAVTVVARLKAKAGQEESLQAALEALIEPTRAESGCVNYDLHRSREDKSQFMFHETWLSREALDIHLGSGHLRAFGEKAADLLSEPLEVTLWEKIA